MLSLTRSSASRRLKKCSRRRKKSKFLEELEKSCFVCLNLHFRAVSGLAVESLETEHLSLYHIII